MKKGQGGIGEVRDHLMVTGGGWIGGSEGHQMGRSKGEMRGGGGTTEDHGGRREVEAGEGDMTEENPTKILHNTSE